MYYICDIMVAQHIKTRIDHIAMTTFFDVNLVYSCLIFGLVPLQSTAHTAFMCKNVCVHGNVCVVVDTCVWAALVYPQRGAGRCKGRLLRVLWR